MAYMLFVLLIDEWNFKEPIKFSGDWLKNENDPEIALCAPPQYDKT